MGLLAEARFYSTGWAFRLGLVQLRYNSQDNYKGLSLEMISRNYVNSGGMTWREFRISRKEKAAAAALARLSAESSRVRLYNARPEN